MDLVRNVLAISALLIGIDCMGQSPSGRNQMAAAYDTDNNMLLVFGGEKHHSDTITQPADNKLWGWDGKAWKILSTEGPSNRNDAKMVYHSKNKKVYLFGGRSYNEKNEAIVYDETWEWNGSKWTLLHPKHTPGKTLHTNMVYDPGRNRIVMFGGAKTEKRDGQPFVNQVWEWDGSDWKIIDAQNPPSPRIGHSMTYSPFLKKTLIVGGVNLEGAVLPEIWSWDGKKFELRDSNVPLIESGQGNAVCMDTPGELKLLLFGRPVASAEITAIDKKKRFGSTWTWNGKEWNEVKSATSPLLRELHVMYFDQSRKRTILFGGNGRAESNYQSFNDTWLFAGDSWHEVHEKYSVGYKVFNHYDYGRSIKPKTDFEGKLIDDERALPIQVSMWYPATAAGTETKMTFGEYVYITNQKNNFKPLTDEQKIQAYEVLRFSAKFGANLDLTDEAVKSIYNTPTSAIKDARVKTGLFPVIISGTDGGPSSNNTLYEHLASLGYIVLSTPSIDRDGTRQANKPNTFLVDRIGNMEYLRSFAQTLTFADCSRIGVLGCNFDGMTGLLYHMKNGEADAVVSIDGWEGKQGSVETIRTSDFFNANEMRAPYLVIQQDEKSPRGGLVLTQEVFDSFVYADRYHYVFKDMGHAFLVSNLYLLPQLDKDKRAAYEYIHNLIGNFFDAYLKKSEAGLSFVKNTADENGFRKDLVKAEIKGTALPGVPSPEEIETMIMAGEFDRVTRILKEAVKHNPKIQLFEMQSLNLYAFRFRQRKQPENVLALRQLGVEAFPGSAEARQFLGDAYAALARKQEAMQSFEKALSLISSDKLLTESGKEEIRSSIEQKMKSVK